MSLKVFGFCERSEALVILFVFQNVQIIHVCILSHPSQLRHFVCVCVCGRTTCLAETLAQPPTSCLVLYCPWERPSPVSLLLHVHLKMTSNFTVVCLRLLLHIWTGSLSTERQSQNNLLILLPVYFIKLCRDRNMAPLTGKLWKWQNSSTYIHTHYILWHIIVWYLYTKSRQWDTGRWTAASKATTLICIINILDLIIYI